MAFLLRFPLTLAICHEGFRLRVRKSICRESKSSFVFHFAGGSQESSQGGTGESSAHADSFDSSSSQFFHGKGRALQAHDHVDGFSNGRANLSDGFEARQPWRIQNIRAGLGKGLQSPYGVVEIGAAMKEVLGSCRQLELASVSRLGRRRD